MRTTVRQLLAGKSNELWTVSPETSVFEALKLMEEKNIGAVLVMTDNKLCGIMSERDYACKVVLDGKSSNSIPVVEIMTSRVLVVHRDQTINNCMALMTDKRIRHLPVIEGEDVVGIISIGDVVKTIIADQEFMIDQLENYIMGPNVLV